jgi:CRISPR-associated protein Cmr6
MKWRYAIPLPGDTRQVLERFPPDKCHNPGLLFDRYAPDWRNRGTLKREGLETVQRATPDRQLLSAVGERWRKLLESQNAFVFEASPEWRLIVGLGRKGPLEVGFTFHRLYGIPLIPGSSLKGIARAYAYLVSGRSEEDADFCAIFGRAPRREEEEGEAKAGRAIFFDAVPADSPRLELDVMNPHFPDYYQGDEPPSNWQSPVPIYFLTVGKGTPFLFGVGWRGELDKEGKRLRDLAVKWLKAGLRELGAGAKTSAGYGYFVLLEAQEKLPSPKAMARGAPVPAAVMQPQERLIWRSGIVRAYRPDKGVGRLVDAETGEEFLFRREAIEDKGWSPGRKARVRYALVEREGRRVIVKVSRA